MRSKQKQKEMLKNHQNNQLEESLHIPVLTKEAINCLQPQAGESYLDLTAGYGGHAELVQRATKSPDKIVLVDRDEAAAHALSAKFPAAQIINTDFWDACERLVSQGRQFDIILADLGVSSPHLNKPERGFAFGSDGPLDMRMDQRQALTAQKLVNELDESDLVELLKKFGEEPKARVIARQIVINRPLSSTKQLAQLITEVYGQRFRPRRIHPATLTFQALRIAVNNELAQIENSLPLMQTLLAPGGRLAIISFHSLEDRLVKQFFKDQTGDRYDTDLRSLTKRPITASHDELVLNPRASSAKLRAVVKIKTERILGESRLDTNQGTE